MPSNWFWLLFTFVAVFVAAGLVFLFVRGEKLGTLSLPARMNVDMLTTTLTVAREGGGGGLPTMQLRVRIPAMFFMQRMKARDAADLADLIDGAATRLRAP